jgi:glucose-6-phosphate 1-dehydrogenase
MTSRQQQAMPTPRDQVIVLFGATGDLAKRKLLPGMYHLMRAGLMPERFRIIGAARKAFDAGQFRELALEAIRDSGRKAGDREAWERFSDTLRFASVGEGFEQLGEEVAAAREELAEDAETLIYLSLPPKAMEATVEEVGSPRRAS